MKPQVQYKGCLVVVIVAAILGTMPVFAASISGLYNTGVNNNGTLATLGTVDSHYALVSVPGGSAGTAWVVPPFLPAFPPWCSGTTNSNWLSPADGAGGIGYACDAGQYDYRLVFSMVDALGRPLDAATATITGYWAADNQVSLLLNGTPVATNNTGFAGLSFFAVSSGFRTGTNTLDFLVINTPPTGANPSGLLVADLSGTAQVPGLVASIRVSQVEICWNTVSNVWCQLQYRSELTSNQWVPFTADWLLGDGSTVCTNDPVLPGQPTRFYRVGITNAVPVP
jgi:hypothetical protein